MYYITLKRTDNNTMVTISTLATNDALTMGYELGRHYADIASTISQHSDHESVVTVKFYDMDDEDTEDVVKVLTNIAECHWHDADYKVLVKDSNIGFAFYEIVVGEELFPEVSINDFDIDESLWVW